VTTLTLWSTRENAELLDERLVPTISDTVTDEIYAVDDDTSGPATRSPKVAFVGRFEGPVTTQQLHAARRRGEQIGPQLAQLPGFVRVVVLLHPTDRRMTVVHLAESAEVLRQVTEIVTSTPLSPDDDPAHLRGPDSVETHQVRCYQSRLPRSLTLTPSSAAARTTSRCAHPTRRTYAHISLRPPVTVARPTGRSLSPTHAPLYERGLSPVAHTV
jgi:hypothetical protein